MTIPPPRQRVRRYIPIFETCPDLTARQCWIDRVKFSIPSVIVSTTSGRDDLYQRLRRRAREANSSFQVGRRGGQVIVEFRDRQWHFGLIIFLSFSDRRWKASGSLDLNAMRFFGARASELGQGSTVSPVHLRRRPDAVSTTLDGNDNFIAATHLPRATRCNWPEFLTSYVDAVSAAVEAELEYEYGGVCGSCSIKLGIPASWTLAAAELCFEFYVENAIDKMTTVASASRALVRDFAETEYDVRWSTIATQGHHEWASYVQFGSGSALVDVAVYAKAFDRLRFEVRYKRHPLRAIRINKASISGPRYLVRLFDALSEKAAARTNRFLRGYRRSVGGTEANLIPLVTALYAISKGITPKLHVTNTIIMQLIQGGGISRSTNPDVQAAIDGLLANNILMQSDLPLRQERRRFILKPRYTQTFEMLRQSGLGLTGPTRLR